MTQANNQPKRADVLVKAGTAWVGACLFMSAGGEIGGGKQAGKV